jgi:lipoprotein-anchoring transpeptidase ErfK/SrfK
MDHHFAESREFVMYARDALRRGDLTEARQWAERAAELAPQSEDPWLILAAVASPRESVNYIRRALQANPESPRAIKGMEWAMQRLRGSPGGENSPGNGRQAKAAARSESPKKRSPLFPVLLVLMGCVVFGFAAWSAVNSPALASILSITNNPQVENPHSQYFAQVEIPKPASIAAIPQDVVAPEPTAIPTEFPTVAPTDEPIVESVPASTSMPEATSTPEATGTPGTLFAEIVPDTPTPEYTAPTAAPAAPSTSPQVAGASGEHWIDVDLSEQRVYAYAGDTIVNSFVVSTGTWQTPTVTGKFRIWIKLRSTDMAGPGYYLPDVPYTLYFHKGYALHGTYWHNNFGTPMSHGCVNLSIPDAAWLYDFAYEGTVVNVHD